MARDIVYFMIDCEASGPVPGLYNLISLGAVVLRRFSDGQSSVHHELGEERYWEIKTIYPGWEMEAERVHRLSRPYIDENGMEPRQAMLELREWTLDMCRNGERPVFVGHNAPFDWMYVNYYFHAMEVDNPYGYNAMDTKAMAAGKHQLLWTDTNKENLLELYPQLVAPPEEQVHNALVDARFQAELLRVLLDE